VARASEEIEARGDAFDGSEFIVSSRRWAHILDRHPELAGTTAIVKEAASSPDEVYEDGRGTLHLLKRLEAAPSDFIVLIVRNEGGKSYLVTAYFMSSRRKTRGYRRFKKRQLSST
jgi:hypothetical protein